MGEMVDYIYATAGAAAVALGGLGGLIMSLSRRHTRVARGFVIASAFPLFLMPITFAWTYPYPLIGFPVAGLSSFVFAMIYSVGISVLNDHLNRADKTSNRRTP